MELPTEKLDELFPDVTPIEQDEGPASVVRLPYAPDYAKTMNLFRACIQAHEISLRVLALTEIILKVSPSHSICWNYRREVLVAFAEQVDWLEEHRRVLEWTLMTPKSYQLWHHRRFVLERLPSVPLREELENIEAVVEEDEFNYQAWSFRQYLVEKAGIWDSEFDYTARKVREAPHNNSVWNHRFFLYQRKGWTEEERIREVRLVAEVVRIHPTAEAAWGYIRGATNNRPESYPAVQHLLSDPLFQNSTFCLILQLETLEKSNQRSDLEAALEVCKKLAVTDSIRSKYWQTRRAEKLAHRLGSPERT